ncbi:MAG: SurA N-terminal domain-containing protein [SAR324 cluster bacterium]|nr:SurA N-terminal domain-containing protein [SAR324 cluster bacterium]
MLTAIRNHAQSWFIKVLLGIIVLTFVISFGIGTFSGTKEVLVRLGNHEILVSDFTRQYQNALENLRQQYPDNADTIAEQTNLRPQIYNQMVNRYLMLKEARAQGFAVTKDELQNAIRAQSMFHVDGNFDFNTYRTILSRNDFTPESYEARMDSVLDRIERCPVPTIAAITGACTGGGAAIAACCDLRIADARLKFGFPIARTLGNCLSVASLARLSAILGQARVREIVFTARLIGADEAQAVGLVSEVLDDAAAVMARAGELAALLASHAPLTLRVTKEGLRRLRQDGPGANDRDLIETAYMSADFKEGMEAFLAKRPPRWKGR